MNDCLFYDEINCEKYDCCECPFYEDIKELFEPDTEEKDDRD